MTPTGRFASVGGSTERPQQCGGTMFIRIPWDVWAAGVLCVLTVCAAIFEPPPIVFFLVLSVVAGGVAVIIICDD